MSRTSTLTLLTTLAVGLGVALPVGAQVRAPVLGEGARVTLDLAKPYLEGSDKLGFTTSVLTANVTVPVQGRVWLFGSLGLAHATLPDYPSSQTTSNPRIGLLMGDADGTRGELSVTLPLSHEFGEDDYATFVALFADLEHVENYTPDLTTLNALVLPVRTLDSGARIGARIGASLGLSEGNTDVLARYAGFGSTRAGDAELEVELSGIATVSSGEGSLSDRTLHHVTLAAGLPDTRTRPKLYLRLPLDHDASDVLSAVVGLRVSF